MTHRAPECIAALNRTLFLLALTVTTGLAAAGADERPAQTEPVCPEPTFGDVAYGPHERNRLDFWQAAWAEPAPLVVHIHGGGFWEGDKSSIRGRRGARVRRCVDNGVALASINYRFLPAAALIDILRDTARALQFLRSKAGEWHIDKERVAAFGDSAGAGSSLWLGFHDDMADPDNADPVLRESTRLRAVGALDPQATYDFPQWPAILKVTPALWAVAAPVIAPSFYRIGPLGLWSEEAKALRHDLDMLSMFDPADPPLYLRSKRPKTPPANWDHLLHHPGHAIALKEKADAVGIPAVLIDRDTPPEADLEVLTFLFEKLGVAEPPRG